MTKYTIYTTKVELCVPGTSADGYEIYINEGGKKYKYSWVGGFLEFEEAIKYGNDKGWTYVPYEEALKEQES